MLGNEYGTQGKALEARLPWTLGPAPLSGPTLSFSSLFSLPYLSPLFVFQIREEKELVYMGMEYQSCTWDISQVRQQRMHQIAKMHLECENHLPVYMYMHVDTNM